MTARPMTEGERARILRWAQMFVADCADRGVPPLHTSGDATLDLARALLSSSAAERAVREALEKIDDHLAPVPAPDGGMMIMGPDGCYWPFPLNAWTQQRWAAWCKRVRTAALSARAGEDEQEQATRGEDAATASPDRL